MEVSVIIPFLNEEENIPFLVKALNEYFTKVSIKAEVVFVNDGSTDSSHAVLLNQKHETYKAKIIKLSKNFGSHAALRAGIINAEGKYVTFMYADLQDPLELIGDMHDKAIQSQADIIWGNRQTVATVGFDGMFSRLYAKLMKKYAISNFPENGFDIVFFNQKVKKEINENIEANSSIFLQILTLGFKHEFISYHKKARKAGKSKWTVSKKIKLLIDSFISFSFAPIRLVTIVGILLFIGGILWTGYITFRELFYGDLAPGWPTLVSILMIGFGITNVSLGIIAEYLWRTLDASRRRKVFIIEDITILNNEK